MCPALTVYLHAGPSLQVNPQGLEARSAPRAWNTGDGRCKVLTLARTSVVQEALSSSGTLSSISLDMAALAAQQRALPRRSVTGPLDGPPK